MHDASLGRRLETRTVFPQVIAIGSAENRPLFPTEFPPQVRQGAVQMRLAVIAAVDRIGSILGVAVFARIENVQCPFFPGRPIPHPLGGRLRDRRPDGMHDDGAIRSPAVRESRQQQAVDAPTARDQRRGEVVEDGPNPGNVFFKIGNHVSACG